VDDTANLAVVTAENVAPVTGADIVFGEKTLLAYDYVAPGGDNVSGEGTGLRVSTRLLEDSAFDVQALVSNLLGKRIGRAQARDFVTGAGHGSNVPEGVTLNTTTTDTWTGAAPTYDDLIDAIHTVDPAYRESGACKWYFNDATSALIEKIQDSNGDPIWRPTGALASTPASNGVLLGYPVVIDQAFANYTDGGAAKFGAFGNLREGYIVRRVRDIHVVVDPYTRAAYRQVVYTVWARADGIIRDPYAYAVLKND
jgi:HK97 family phage major capsid protein